MLCSDNNNSTISFLAFLTLSELVCMSMPSATGVEQEAVSVLEPFTSTTQILQLPATQRSG